VSDQVEEIKQKIDIVELVGEQVTLKKAGRHYKGLCPFHSEKTPSFIVSPERQSYKCFGCGESGDVFSFIQKYEGYSFLEALEILAKKAGVTLASYQPTQADQAKKRLLSLLALSAEFYRYLLEKHAVGERARQYLKKRGVGAEARERYYLGYAPGQWQGVSAYLAKKGYRYEEMEAVGMVLKSQGGRWYDRFRDRVMFPLRDHQGRVVGFSGRMIKEKNPSTGSGQEAKYINSPETTLYHKGEMLYGLWEGRREVKQADQVVLVEGELDVIASYQAGVRNVAAIKGSAFTQEMGRLITRYTRNVLMSLDADQAGIEAVKRAVQVAEPIDLSIRVVQVEGGKDPADVATADAKKWRELVKGASLYWDFLITQAKNKYDVKGGAGAQAITEEVLPQLAQVSNLVVRAHYAQELAKLLGVREEVVYEELERVMKKQELVGLKAKIKKIEQGEGEGRRQRVEEYLLSLVLQYYSELGELIRQSKSEWWSLPSAKKVWERLQNYQGEWGIKQFVRGLPAELVEIVDRNYLRDLSQVTDPRKEAEKIRFQLEELYLRDELKKLAEQIAKLEGEGKEIKEIQEEFRVRSRQLAELS